MFCIMDLLMRQKTIFCNLGIKDFVLKIDMFIMKFYIYLIEKTCIWPYLQENLSVKEYFN